MQKMYKTVGPASYAAGGFTFNATDFKKVDNAVPSGSGGYKAEIAGISGNTITVKVLDYTYAATATGPAAEVAAATDLSAVTFYINVEGI